MFEPPLEIPLEPRDSDNGGISPDLVPLGLETGVDFLAIILARFAIEEPTDKGLRGLDSRRRSSKSALNATEARVDASREFEEAAEPPEAETPSRAC